jgi:CDP-glucose 4,6-dehydratase
VEGLELNPQFWRGRRVFVTGHTGFKGSWLLLLLRELGADIHAFSLAPPTDPSLFDLLGLESACRHRVGDIRDQADLTDAMAAADPEVVLHLAAQPLVRASYVDPVGTYATNVMGTVHLLDACRTLPNLCSVVVVTTDKCYQNDGWVWGYRENDRLGGDDPYSNSKAACELVVDAYRKSFFNPADHARHGVGLASARAGNVIGGGDFAVDRLVPDAVAAFAKGEKLSIRNPLAIRPWQHVLDPLHGYLLLAERAFENPTFASGWNFGPPAEENASVGAVADRLAARWGGGAGWEQNKGDHPHEAATLKLDSTKARLQLGWAPRFSLDEALDSTVDWYRAYHGREDLGAVSLGQVQAFLGRPAQ